MRRQTTKLPSRMVVRAPNMGLSAHMLEAEDDYEDEEDDEGLNPTEAARRAVQRPRRDEAAEVCPHPLVLQIMTHLVHQSTPCQVNAFHCVSVIIKSCCMPLAVVEHSDTPHKAQLTARWPCQDSS